MSEAKSPMRTPLGRVRHHGAAAAGTSGFIGQRVSAIALIVLGSWFVLSTAFSMEGPTLEAARAYLSAPLNAVGVILLVVAGLYHMQTGMQEIILDYVEKPVAKYAALLLNGLVPVVLGAGAIFAVMMINFGS
jgi:succinate dehydrogenase / fumarate reductase membrane anchor subunit